MVRDVYLFIVSVVVFSGLATILFDSPALAANPLVVDLSWPNCGVKLNNLTPSGIVGVNDGLDYSHNPCLSAESQDFHNPYSLYLNTGYPGISYGLKFAHYPNNCRRTNLNCIAYNYGYNDVQYSLKYADDQDVHSFDWWLDVETDNSWTTSYEQNRQALEGMIAALESSSFMPSIGFYSYPAQWQLITSSWHNQYPVWIAAASSSENVAKGYCSKSFDSGPTWLSQYTTTLDYNYSCLPKAVDSFKIM